MLHALIALAALAGTGGGGDTPPPANPPKAKGGDRESLEQFLERARAQRQAVQEKLEGNVSSIIHLFDAFDTKPGAAVLNGIADKLVALGTDATPLLLKYLDPGDAAIEKERVRAAQVANALGRMDTTAVTDQLVRMLEQSSTEGKRNVLRVLERTQDKARVQPVVEALFKKSDGALRQSCLRALINLGGTHNDALLAEVLASNDDTLVAMALNGLAEAKNAAAVDKVRAVLTGPGASQVAISLLGYFKAMPNVCTESDIDAFLHLAQSGPSLDTRIAIVESIPGLGASLNADLRKNMQPIVDSPERKLSDAGMVVLARMGDRNMRKELLKPYDERITDNDRWAQAWIDRGDIYARIGDDENAIKDFQKAFVVGKDDPTFQQGDCCVKMARSLCRKGRLKEAADKLRMAPISLQQLQALADDPDFKELRDSKYGKDVFGTGK